MVYDRASASEIKSFDVNMLHRKSWLQCPVFTQSAQDFRHNQLLASSLLRCPEKNYRAFAGMPQVRPQTARSKQSSNQPANRLAVIDVVGPILLVVEHRPRRDAEGVINRCGHVLRFLRAGGREAAVFVRGADDHAAANAAAGEEDGLYGAPMIAAGTVERFRQRGQLRRPAELAGHHDQSAVQ